MAKWDLCFVQLAQSNGAESDGVHVHTVYAYVNTMYFLLVSNSWLRLDCWTFGDVMQLHFGVELERRKQTQETASCSEWSGYSLNSNGSQWQCFECFVSKTSCEKKDRPKALSTCTQRWREWLVNLRTIGITQESVPDFKEMVTWSHGLWAWRSEFEICISKTWISRISRISLDRGSNRLTPAPTCQCQKLPGGQLSHGWSESQRDFFLGTCWVKLSSLGMTGWRDDFFLAQELGHPKEDVFST